MNFQAVDQEAGKNVTMWATLSTWDGISFSTNNAKLLTCKLVDDNGVEHKCRIYEGKGSLPGQEHLNKRIEFSISSYQGTYQGNPYTGYSGFWSHGAVKTSQDTCQSPPQPAGATKAPQQVNNDVEIRKCVVCAYLASGNRPLAEDVEYWMRFIGTGIDASLPQNVNPENTNERAAQDNDVPW